MLSYKIFVVEACRQTNKNINKGSLSKAAAHCLYNNLPLSRAEELVVGRDQVGAFLE